MTKLLIMPSNINIEGTLEYSDGYLFGLKDMSVNMPLDITLEEVKNINKIIKENNKELFISLNKNFLSSELDDLKIVLKELDSLDITGIFYADTCFINLKKELDLKTPLVWSQEHLTTNYETINFWKSYGVEYTYLSSEITLEEIKEIRENTTSKLIVPIFGYLPMFTSKRHAVKNYLDNFKLEDNSKINYIEKENKIYPIIDNKEGTVTYSSHILNGYEEYKTLDKIDYVTLNSFDIKEDIFNKIVKIYKEKTESEESIEALLDNLDKGFLYKETIYKVKNYE